MFTTVSAVWMKLKIVYNSNNCWHWKRFKLFIRKCYHCLRRKLTHSSKNSIQIFTIIHIFRSEDLIYHPNLRYAQLKGSRTLKAICILSSYSIEFLHLQEYRTLIDEIRQFYFGNDTIDESSLLKYYEFLSDINFFWGIDQSVKHLAASSKGKTFYMWYGTFDSIWGWN